MAGPGGKRLGAGRPKGSKNRPTIAREAQVASTGETPLDYMLRVMRDVTAEHDRRDRAAAAAAPYVHRKLAAMEVSGKDGAPIQVNIAGDDTALL